MSMILLLVEDIFKEEFKCQMKKIKIIKKKETWNLGHPDGPN